ncbi:DnaA ATPase domain-containing protein [Rhodopirellula sp. MGV]|uniref:DnaA/Hda family protein n=1 Tax=Rhodopirellula sp. MGV TaxID=2023130 RepID=UPI0013041168|nr:DnaA/Hda family protein [Rhodopirellula sp. MGV]
MAAFLANALAAFLNQLVKPIYTRLFGLDSPRGRDGAIDDLELNVSHRSMMEDCAPGMSTTQGCNDDSDVIVTFKEALKQRVGAERYQIWFSGIEFDIETPAADEGNKQGCIIATARGQFAADRLSKNFMSSLRAAASAACGSLTNVRIDVASTPVQQVGLPFDDAADTNSVHPNDSATADGVIQPAAQDTVARDASAQASAKSSGLTNTGSANKRKPANRRPQTQSIAAILADGIDSRKTAAQPSPTVPAPRRRETQSAAAPAPTAAPATAPGMPASTRQNMRQAMDHRWDNFVTGACNKLAVTACEMTIESPRTASPLVLWGPPGSGKSHLLGAVAKKLRAVHRLRQVIIMSAEDFTNDFIKALHGNSLPAFRSRFRDASALLIDDIQFFVDKKATIRELQHTIEMFAEAGKPLVFAGTKAPTEIKGLGGELSGRLASGLVCQVNSLDFETRVELLKRYADTSSPDPWPQAVLEEIAESVDGDGRLLIGVANLVSLLHRMYGAMPTMEQIRQHGSHLLRSSGVPITLQTIEQAVEKVFQLEGRSLQSGSQAKSLTGPRMLAMYLSREMTGSPFSEIGGHYGGRSHSTAILASQRVRQWIDGNKKIGRGQTAIATDEAIRRIEAMLKTG